MRWRTLLIFLPFALLAMALAVANRAPVTISLDPFSSARPALTLEAPFAVILLAAVFVGLVIGAAGVWWDQGRYRRKARAASRALARATSASEAEPRPGLPRLR